MLEQTLPPSAGAPPDGDPTPRTLGPGARIRGTPYVVVRKLGAGGMGVVYEVRHGATGARHALKMIHRPFAHEREFVGRFRLEVTALRKLNGHPNVVNIVEVGKTRRGHLYYVMELLEGDPLRELFRDAGGPLPLRRALTLTLDVLAGLSAAHAAGVFHRDIKPHNVFVTKGGAAKIIDFGIAKASFAVAGKDPTRPGVFLGTPSHTAPELLGKVQATVQSDLYSVGVVLWEALTGQPPFVDGHVWQTLASVVTQGVPSLEEVGFGALPERLREIVRRVTQRDPALRHASADELAADLRAVLALVPPDDGPAPARARPGGPGLGPDAPTLAPAWPGVGSEAPNLAPARPGVGPDDDATLVPAGDHGDDDPTLLDALPPAMTWRAIDTGFGELSLLGAGGRPVGGGAPGGPDAEAGGGRARPEAGANLAAAPALLPAHAAVGRANAADGRDAGDASYGRSTGDAGHEHDAGDAGDAGDGEEEWAFGGAPAGSGGPDESDDVTEAWVEFFRDPTPAPPAPSALPLLLAPVSEPPSAGPPGEREAPRQLSSRDREATLRSGEAPAGPAFNLPAAPAPGEPARADAGPRPAARSPNDADVGAAPRRASSPDVGATPGRASTPEARPAPGRDSAPEPRPAQGRQSTLKMVPARGPQSTLKMVPAPGRAGASGARSAPRVERASPAPAFDDASEPVSSPAGPSARARARRAPAGPDRAGAAGVESERATLRTGQTPSPGRPARPLARGARPGLAALGAGVVRGLRRFEGRLERAPAAVFYSALAALTALAVGLLYRNSVLYLAATQERSRAAPGASAPPGAKAPARAEASVRAAPVRAASGASAGAVASGAATGSGAVASGAATGSGAVASGAASSGAATGSVASAAGGPPAAAAGAGQAAAAKSAVGPAAARAAATSAPSSIETLTAKLFGAAPAGSGAAGRPAPAPGQPSPGLTTSPAAPLGASPADLLNQPKRREDTRGTAP